MGRYIKKFPRVGMSLGPSEERGFALWIGYDIAGCEGDLGLPDLICVDSWSAEELEERGVLTFVTVGEEEQEVRRKLGL